VARIKHGTLTANTVTTVTLDDVEFSAVEVLNVDGTAAIYFRVDNIDPTVAGDDCEVVPASISVLRVDLEKAAPSVRLISAGTPKFSVRGQ
jgi:hypothetical protein